MLPLLYSTGFSSHHTHTFGACNRLFLSVLFCPSVQCLWHVLPEGGSFGFKFVSFGCFSEEIWWLTRVLSPVLWSKHFWASSLTWSGIIMEYKCSCLDTECALNYKDAMFCLLSLFLCETALCILSQSVTLQSVHSRQVLELIVWLGVYTDQHNLMK